MFGYVKPFQNELKIKEYEIYKAVYCGLCKELGRLFGRGAGFVLSYDFTFLALLYMGMTEDPSFRFEKERCLYHPAAKRGICVSNESLRYAAHLSCITFYHKVKDNLADSPLWKKTGYAALLPFASRVYKKAAAEYPALAKRIAEQMEKQRELEKAGCSSVDEAAEPTALCLSAICEEISSDPSQRRVLSRLGYFLGRWIYLCDGLDDLEEDLKSGGYNPFLKREGDPSPDEKKLAAIRENAVGSLNMTLGELAKAYDLLNIRQFKPILDNIIFLGLQGAQHRVITRREKEQDRSFPFGRSRL